MADQEFDRREAGGRLRSFAREVESIERGLGSIVDRYSDQLPTSEGDEAEYRAGFRNRLIEQRSAINNLLDRLQ